ncbi:LegC family aminotransferase [Paenibacillus oryzisoli]|uniref:LegC family aminotransferase n=1 Tax=Paenibacillus oryzisoli TaxID=1850517 RepID=UPI003D280CCC
MNNIWSEIASQIKELYIPRDIVPLHTPTFIGNEEQYVVDCIRTGWVSSVGKYVDVFEKKLAEFTGVKRAVAVVNGTAALHMALKVAGVQENDEILIPSLTFVATANAVRYCQAVPHFIDVSDKTLGIDAEKLEAYLQEITMTRDNVCVNKHTGRVIRAVIPMHTFGHPVEIEKLINTCEKYRLLMIEDAAESLGSYYQGTHTGNFGKVAAISFNGNKIITTGGGGAILTNDEELANYAKHLTTTAKLPHRWQYNHDEVGYNYRLPNLNAALGCAQLENLPVLLERKRELTNYYEQIFCDFQGVTLFKEPSYAKSNYWLQTLVIDDKKFEINETLEVLNNYGIMARPIWTPLHYLVPFRHFPKSDLTATEKLEKKVINIPSSPII